MLIVSQNLPKRAKTSINNRLSVFLAGSWDTATFITSYLPIALFFVLFFGFKIIKRAKSVSYEDMDLVTGNREGIVKEDPVPPRYCREDLRKSIGRRFHFDCSRIKPMYMRR